MQKTLVVQRAKSSGKWGVFEKSTRVTTATVRVSCGCIFCCGHETVRHNVMEHLAIVAPGFRTKQDAINWCKDVAGAIVVGSLGETLLYPRQTDPAPTSPPASESLGYVTIGQFGD